MHVWLQAGHCCCLGLGTLTFKAEGHWRIVDSTLAWRWWCCPGFALQFLHRLVPTHVYDHLVSCLWAARPSAGSTSCGSLHPEQTVRSWLIRPSVRQSLRKISIIYSCQGCRSLMDLLSNTNQQMTRCRRTTQVSSNHWPSAKVGSMLVQPWLDVW